MRASAYMLTVKSTRISDRLELGLKRCWKQRYYLSPLGFHGPHRLIQQRFISPNSRKSKIKIRANSVSDEGLCPSS